MAPIDLQSTGGAHKCPHTTHDTPEKRLVIAGSVFYWGCITWEGVGRLIPIHGRLKAAKYTKILCEGFLGALANYKLTPSDIVSQQDRDPKHMAALTTKWLSDRKVKVLPWPAGSPDLNIIEHVWDHLKEKVRAHRPSPGNKAEL
ncbi:Transposable element Tcb2 transposase [Ceratobasidium sp. AG-Ba]|nr:Transposable element Tcb2 transposase [Ceratobasidium sp. AG-Ba]